MARYPGAERERRIEASRLLRQVTAIFAVCGMSDDDAAVLADSLVQADLRGIHSHGVAKRRGWGVGSRSNRDERTRSRCYFISKPTFEACRLAGCRPRTDLVRFRVRSNALLNCTAASSIRPRANRNSSYISCAGFIGDGVAGEAFLAALEFARGGSINPAIPATDRIRRRGRRGSDATGYPASRRRVKARPASGPSAESSPGRRRPRRGSCCG